jgi:hypothetical protein
MIFAKFFFEATQEKQQPSLTPDRPTTHIMTHVTQPILHRSALDYSLDPAALHLRKVSANVYAQVQFAEALRGSTLEAKAGGSARVNFFVSDQMT